MEFRKSLIISIIIHILLIVFLPGFKFAERLNWVEVSVITFPNMKEMSPDWQAGKRVVPEPAKELASVDKTELSLPVQKSDIGIPVVTENPQIQDFIEEKNYDFIKEDFEKVVPGRKDRKGIIDGQGEDNIPIISGPVMKRKIVRSRHPKYPAWAEEKGVEGEVDLKFWVSPQGMVTRVELVKTSGYPELDSGAIGALKFYLFSPLGKDEEQKEQWGTIRTKYTLK